MYTNFTKIKMNNYLLLNQLYNWYILNKKELLKTYENKYLIIRNFEVVESFNNENDAYLFAVNKYGLGSDFILQHCVINDKFYSMYSITSLN